MFINNKFHTFLILLIQKIDWNRYIQTKIMIRSQLCLLVILLGTLKYVQSGSQQTITYTCMSVSTSVCGSGIQFSVYGTFESKVLNYTYCAPSTTTCSTSSVNLFVQTCNFDYRNNQCGPKICYMLINQNVCQKRTSDCTATPYSTNYSCIDCVKNTSCSKCYSAVTNNPKNSTPSEQICFGANCTEGFSASTAKYVSCPNGIDYLGQKCSCCVQTVQVSRFCITNNDVLNRDELTSWYNSQLKLKGVLITFVLAVIMMIL